MSAEPVIRKIASLDDVSLASLSDGDLLQWNAATGKFKNASSGSLAASSLDSYGPGNPFYVAHRGSSFVYPENTIKAYLASLAAGHSIIKAGDYWTLADGLLASMHDQTLDRTTNGAGNVQAQTSGSLAAISVDPSTWFAPNWPNLPIPLAGEVFSALQGRAIMFLDAKSGGSGAALVSALQRWNLTKNVVLVSFTPAELAAAKAAGIICGYEDATANPVIANAAGCKYIICDFTQISDGFIATAHAAGLKVLLYTVNSRYWRDHWQALGVDGFFSDDPSWLDGTLPLLTADPFATQTWYPGMIPWRNNVNGYRGTFLGGNRWGLQANGSYSVCMGFLDLGPAPPPTWHLQVTLTFDAISPTGDRHPGIGFCVDIDQFSEGGVQGNGYHAFLRENGQLQLFDNTTNLQLGATIATAAITTGNTATLKIDVTPTTVTVTRTDSGGFTPISVDDTSHRGRYTHFLKNDSGAGGGHYSFSGVSRT